MNFVDEKRVSASCASCKESIRKTNRKTRTRQEKHKCSMRGLCVGYPVKTLEKYVGRDSSEYARNSAKHGPPKAAAYEPRRP